MQLRALAAFCATLAAGPAWGSNPFAVTIPGTRPENRVEVPGTVVSDGIPTHLEETHSTWSADDLFAFFFQRFHDASLYVANEGSQMRRASGYNLTGFDPLTMTSYTVILQPTPGGGTSIVLGAAKPTQRKRPDTGSDAVPTYPGAQNVLRTNSEGFLGLTYEAEAKPEEVAAFYGDTLGRAGYAAQKEPGVWRAAGREVQLVVRPISAHRTGVSVLYRERPSELEHPR